MRRAICAVGLLCGLLVANRGYAQTDATRARAAFQRGVNAFENGRYRDALENFQQAYRIKPNPVVLFNIAQAEAELSRPASAVAHYEQYLRQVAGGYASQRGGGPAQG